ncbi:hypothetical protein PLICRDRAFT_175659 [Plicaturopsis crispa FD-325 SS-3]|nr:hypothetical protein PLICRDRAFT_175659 [Plicaturopsis crispa FD-325 SS-3]
MHHDPRFAEAAAANAADNAAMATAAGPSSERNPQRGPPSPSQLELSSTERDASRAELELFEDAGQREEYHLETPTAWSDLQPVLTPTYPFKELQLVACQQPVEDGTAAQHANGVGSALATRRIVSDLLEESSRQPIDNAELSKDPHPGHWVDARLREVSDSEILYGGSVARDTAVDPATSRGASKVELDYQPDDLNLTPISLNVLFALTCPE